MPDRNVTCVPKVGMFKLHKEKMNFTAAQEICIEEGGYLANVLSEQKTNALSSLIASMYSGRGKHLVYVGLHDSDMEGQYINMKDEPMDCFTWRAWAPNQPRSKYKTEDCVVLTTDRNWKVVNCTQQMPFLCELQPGGPYNICEGR
uniref:Collectin-11 n=2 Tax=Cacopsylla melanoneura TaxID=428564 RepID=A0A8D8QDW3_9HEMI